MPSILFKECVDVLSTHILHENEQKIISKDFRKLYPISDWGRIDWTKIKYQASVDISEAKKII